MNLDELERDLKAQARLKKLARLAMGSPEFPWEATGLPCAAALKQAPATNAESVEERAGAVDVLAESAKQLQHVAEKVEALGADVRECKDAVLSPESTKQLQHVAKTVEVLGADVRECKNAVIKVDRAVETLASQKVELQRAKERLDKMYQDGLLKFAQQIDPDSFRVFCAILMHGDIAKAGRALNIKDSTLRSQVKNWEKRGGIYEKLVDLVRWRKESRVCRGTVPLNGSIMTDSDDSTDYPGVLSGVFGGLLEMNEENTEDMADELEGRLR